MKPEVAIALVFLGLCVVVVVESLQCFEAAGYCDHDGTCFDNPNATCTCKEGFWGKRCRKNGMLKMITELEEYNGTHYDNIQARVDTAKVMRIMHEHIYWDYELTRTVNYTNQVLGIVTSKVRHETKKNKDMDEADFLPLIEDYVKILTTIVTILNDKGCNHAANCSSSSTDIKQTDYPILLDTAEDNVIDITSVMVMTDVEEGQMNTFDLQDTISFTILKSKGKDLPFHYQTQYGSVTLPYYETFQDKNKNKMLAFCVLTYHKSPYGFVNNKDAVDSGVLKVFVTDKNGKRIELRDKDDPVDMTLDMTKIFSSTDTWEEMTRLSDGRSFFVAFKNETYPSYVIEFNIKSQTVCEMFGLFGYTGLPTKGKYDMRVRTQGINKVLYQYPYKLPLTFIDQRLQITVYNTKYARGGYLDPLVLTLKCADDVAKRKKRQASAAHEFRMQELTLSELGGSSWEDPKSASIDRAEGNHMKFKSTFFGTFASNTLLIAPAAIDFKAIFGNFLERITETPQVLITFVVLFILVIILTVLLRRLDNKDQLYWDYLPLVDNKKEETFEYSISAFTAIRSSRIMTATPFFILEGSNGSTDTRILSDSQRQNFRSGTCSNFLLKTNTDLGKLKKLTIWTDSKGKSPDWKLSKVIVIDLSTDESYTFLCGQWISKRYGNCDTWAALEPLSKDFMAKEAVFTETTTKGFFDDHLWFSISKRPNYSQFTRVQRLWTLMALLFLSMVASAMWFNQEPDPEEQDKETASTLRTVEVGPFKLSYKQLFVGFMSSLITLIPSIVIVAIFKNRRLKPTYRNGKDIEKGSTDDTKKNKKLLPWWSLFIAYSLIGICVATGGFFTFLYSLEFGSDKTNDWLLSFVFGTVLGVFVLEPVKVILFAILIACCLQRLSGKSTDVGDVYKRKKANKNNITVKANIFRVLKTEDDNVEADEYEMKFYYYPCPSTKIDNRKAQLKKKRFKLDNELADHLKSGLLCVLYVILLAMICSHNVTTDACRQNNAMSLSINDSFLANTTDDIWTWLFDYYIPGTWTKFYGNGDLRTAYEQRFTYDQYNYRMSKIQLRQVRSYGNCSAPKEVQNVVTRCTNDYDMETQSTENFCPGWVKFNDSCFDENELTDYSFHYKSPEEVKALSYFGHYAHYGGGGYQMQLGPKLSIVLQHVTELKNKSWIDGNTRAIFVDSNTFNANSRLFTHLKVVFEISEYGAIAMQTVSKSSNLYPYVYPLDYIILCLQIIFVIIILVKMVLFGINVFKLKKKCFVTFGMWIDLTEILCGILSIVFFILRIDKTIKAVDDINNSNGGFVSFEEVEIYDEIYRICLACVFFLVILRLLKPLSFNYHVFILQRSLFRAKTDLISYLFLLTLCLVAFASYLYLTIGSTVDDFKSMPTSLRTLLQMLLSMISFRFNVEMSSLQAQVVVSLFAFSVSIIGINVFIGILTWNFYYIKLLQTEENVEPTVTRFNQDLNDHFWWRVDKVIRKLVLPSLQSDPKNPLYRRVEQKIDSLHEKFKDIAREEIEWTFYASTMMFMCKKKYTRRVLGCSITALSNSIQYRFFDQHTKSTQIILYLPFVKPGDAPEIVCTQVPAPYYLFSGIQIPHGASAKSDVFELSIINGDSQKIKNGCIITLKFRPVVGSDIMQFSSNNMGSWQMKLLRENESLGVFSCRFPTLPTHCFLVQQESVKLDIGELQQFPDLERHRLIKPENTIRLNTDKRINISFSANSIQENGDIIFMVEKPFGALCPILQLYSTRKIAGKITISLPLNFQPTTTVFPGLTRDLWVLIREKNFVWKKLQCKVEVDLDRILLHLTSISLKTPTAFCVKEVLLPWGHVERTTQEGKFVNEITKLSENVVFRRQWKDLAEKCSVNLTSKFEEYYNPFFISVENRKYVFNLDRCSFRRIIRVPITDQEKCLAVLSTWMKGLTTLTGVTSLVSLLREYNLPYLPET